MSYSIDDWLFKKFRIVIRECTLNSLLLLLLVVSIVAMFVFQSCTIVFNLSLSYVSGIIIYVLTSLLPQKMHEYNMKRRIIGDLDKLHACYKVIIRNISYHEKYKKIYSYDQVCKGVVKFNTCMDSDWRIGISANKVEMIRVACNKALSLSKKISSDSEALTTDEMFAIYEISQVWFIQDIAKLPEGQDYVQEKSEMYRKLKYLMERYHDFDLVYQKIDNIVRNTVGRHPKSNKTSNISNHKK